MKKRILALSLAAAMVVGALASCNGSETPVTSSQEAVEARDVSLVLWGSQEDQDYLKGVAADFCTKYSADHEDVKSVAIEVQVVGEDNSANEVMKDPAAAADVFGMPTDQIKRLADAKAIFAMPDDVAADIKAFVGQANYDGTVYDGKSYGYPYTVNIAQALYYNTDVFTEEDVASLNKMLEKDIGDVKAFGIDAGAFHSATWYFTGGAELFTNSDKNVCTFDNDDSVAILKFVQENKDKIFIKGGDAANMIKDGKLAAWGDGSWAVQGMKAAFGDKMGVAKMPTITVDGKDYQMKCFGGVKFYAVNAASKEPEVAIALAQFISNEENQMKRYEMRQAIPTAVSLQDNAKIKEDPSVKAYAEQMAFTVVQSPVIPGGWWEDSKALFESIYNGEVAADDIKAKVAEHVASWKTME